MTSPRTKPCPGRAQFTGRCPNKVTKKGELCQVCSEIQKKKDRQYDHERYYNDPGRRYWQSAAGKRERKAYLDAHPLCERCEKKGLTVEAKRVHHIDQNQLNRLDENKEALCVSCHEEEHKDERWKIY